MEAYNYNEIDKCDSDDHNIDMLDSNMCKGGIGTQNTTSNSNKRKRENVCYCCMVCKLTSSNPSYNPNYMQADHAAARLEQVGIEDKDDNVGIIKQDLDVVVNLQNFKGQVVMTVNPPTAAGFKLSLDDVGWIAAASSNTGLLLCTSDIFSHSKYYICNPFNNQLVTLPPIPRVRTVCIGFIVSPSPLACGNISQCNFQVLRFHNKFKRSQYEVHTFSSQTGEWTKETINFPQQIMWNVESSFSSMYHHGRLHWFVKANGLVVYDPSQKKFTGVIKNPSKRQVCHSCPLGGIGLSAGSFWLSQFASTCYDFRFWQLKGYDTPTDDLDQCYWKPMFKFNFGVLTGGPKWAPKSQNVEVLAFHPHHPNIVYLQLYHGRRCYLVECNLLTKTLGPSTVRNDSFGSWTEFITLDAASPYLSTAIPSSTSIGFSS